MRLKKNVHTKCAAAECMCRADGKRNCFEELNMATGKFFCVLTHFYAKMGSFASLLLTQTHIYTLASSLAMDRTTHGHMDTLITFSSQFSNELFFYFFFFTSSASSLILQNRMCAFFVNFFFCLVFSFLTYSATNVRCLNDVCLEEFITGAPNLHLHKCARVRRFSFFFFYFLEQNVKRSRSRMQNAFSYRPFESVKSVFELCI